MPRLSRSFSFHFLWSSSLASGFADRLAMLAVAVMLGQGVIKGALADERLADSSIMAAINFWFFLPYVLWGPLAGWLADRLPRKWLMFISDEARAVIILLAWLLLPDHSRGAVAGLYDTWITIDWLGGLTLTHTWKIWAIMFSIGLFAATFSPARNSVIPNVVGYSALQRANSVVIGMGVIGNLIGFAVGGPLAENVVHLCILCSAFSYLVPGWMWPFLKTPMRRHDRPGLRTQAGPLNAVREIVDGGRYILRHRPVLVLVVVSILFWSGSHVIMAAGSAIAVDLYGGAISDFAAIGGGFGAGMMLGAIALGLINNRHGNEVILVAAMLGVAAGLSLLATVAYLAAGIVIAIVMGFFGGLIMITANAMMQQLTADGFRGRVMGFNALVSDLAGVAVSFVIWRMSSVTWGETGWTTDQVVLNTVHLFSAVMLFVAGWGTWRYLLRGPAPTRWANLLWRMDRLYASGLHKLRTAGLENLPHDGPVILVCKHTAGVDPLLVQAAAPRMVRWMMAAEYRHGTLGWLWRVIRPIAVKRDGRDRSAARQALDALDDGQVLGIFPEGHLPENPGEMRSFGPGVTLVAGRSDAPIVPVWISDTPHASSVFGSFWRPSRSRIVFGEPFTLNDLDIPDPGDRRAVTEAVQQRVRQLGERADAGEFTFR